MLHQLANHRTAALLLMAIAGMLLHSAGPLGAQEEPGMAPGKRSAPTLEAALYRLLRTDNTGQYSMSALHLSPSFWQAVAVDRGPEARNNMFQGLFADGVLFGIGPTESLLGARRKGEGPVTRWSAPATMRAVLQLQWEQPAVTITLPPGHAGYVSRIVQDADPESLLGQLELIFFPIDTAPGAQSMAELADSMTLVVTGIQPAANHVFTWVQTQQQQQVVGSPLEMGFNAGLGQSQGFGQVRNRTQGRHQIPRIGPMGDGMGGGGMAGAGMMGPGLGGGGGFGGGGLAEGAPGGIGPASVPAEGPMPAESMRPPRYPTARTASVLGGGLLTTVAQSGGQVVEAYAGVEGLGLAEGRVTLEYWTNPTGRQEVEVRDGAGEVVETVKSGPASRNGTGLVSWGPPGGAAEPDGDYAFLVRNAIETPHGAQVAEAKVDLPRFNPHEPESIIAPTMPATTDLTIAEVSVAADVLHIRAQVAPISAPGGEIKLPDLHVKVTDEAGNVVRRPQPVQAESGAAYIVIWDCTDEDQRRVPDGRYLLWISTGTESGPGAARSEVRFWVDVPLDRAQKRLEAQGTTVLGSVQAHLQSHEEGELVFAYVLPYTGQASVFVESAEGLVVRHLFEGPAENGLHTITWDGADNDGNPLPDSRYGVHFEVDSAERGAWGLVTVESLE